MTDDIAPPRLRMIALGKLYVNPFSQRGLKVSRVDHLLRHFDLDLLGIPEVSDQDDGTYSIIDGQHRVEALKQWLGDGWETQKIQCRVWSDLTEAQEADRFDRLADVLSVTTYDRFRVRLNAGRAVQVDIDRQVRLEGLTISRDNVPGGIGAVGTLERVYHRVGPSGLGRTLRIIRDAYGDAGLDGVVIDGIGHVVARYNGELNDDHATAKLAKANGGVGGLIGRANIVREKMGTSKSQAVAAAAVEFINTGKGGKKLPSWWAAA